MKKITGILAVLLAMLMIICSCGNDNEKDSLTFAQKIENIDLDNFSVNAAVSLSFSDAFFDLVADGDDSSVAMLKELGVNGVGGAVSISRFKDLYSLSGYASVNNENIIDANAVVDTVNGDLYLSVPELNKTSLKLGLDDLGLGEIMAAAEMFKSLSDSKEVDFDYQMLMELYADTAKFALTTLPEPKKSSEKITVLGVSQNVTAVEYAVTAEDLVNSTSEVMDWLVHDERFKKLSAQAFPLIMSALEEYIPELALFSNFSSDDIEDMYDSYVIPMFEDMSDELMNELEYEDFETIYLTYYESGNTITGFSIEADGSVVYMRSARSGGKLNAEAVVGGQTVATFKGTDKKGLVSGSLDFGGYSIKIEDLDVDALARGIVRFTVVLDSSILGGELPADMLVKFKTDMDFVTSNLFAVELYQKSSRVLRCAFGLTIDEGSGKANVPKKTSNDVEAWAMGCVDGIDNVVDNLSKAGISKKYMSTIKSAATMLKSQASSQSSYAPSYSSSPFGF